MKRRGLPTRDCDVLVIGAGPAGSSAAAAAADAGAHVIMIDRRRLIGSPPRCAGFVPMQLFHSMSMSRGVIAQRVERMITSYPHGIEDKRSFGYIVHRELFDQQLAVKAEDAGTELLAGHRAAVRTSDGIVVESEAGTLLIRSRVVIGADGPLSAAGRWIGAVNKDLLRAAQWRIRLKEALIAIHVHFSQMIHGGYGWLFPQGDTAVAGVAVAADSRERPVITLRRFVSLLEAEGKVETGILAATGGMIPVGGPLACRGGNVLLTGDAAGHCHPVTGAGIATAVLGGNMAGSAAAGYALGGKEIILREYEAEINDTIGDSLRHAAARRDEMHDAWQADDDRFCAALRRSWVAFPEYGRL